MYVAQIALERVISEYPNFHKEDFTVISAQEFAKEMDSPESDMSEWFGAHDTVIKYKELFNPCPIDYKHGLKGSLEIEKEIEKWLNQLYK
jgi:hypothetical protein